MNEYEIANKHNVDGIDSIMEKKNTGIYNAFEQEDKIILLDFSSSMSNEFEGKELYKHLIDAVRGYEREYVMIAFRSSAETITHLEAQRPSGTTDLTSALRIAYGKGAAEYIIVSDGIPDYAEESLKYAKDNKMKCSTIFLGDSEKGRLFMARLAGETGGKSDDIKLLKGFGGVLARTIKGLIEG